MPSCLALGARSRVVLGIASVTLLLSFGFGAVLSAFLPIAAFLPVLGLASLLSLLLSRSGTLAELVLRISADAACAQLGYVFGLAILALISRARLRRPLPLRDAEDDSL